jgi:plastocyanin
MPEPLPPTDPELRAELGIPETVPIHRIDLSGRGDFTRVIPQLTEAGPGDVVQFVVLDHRVHLVSFRDELLRPDQIEFLRATSQARFPPLVEQGSRLVLSFEGAPAGDYSFYVEGNGPPIEAVIRVTGP